MSNLPNLDGMTFNCLAEEDVAILSVSFSATEIEVEVATSDENKSPGPD
ncbi:hypothetical protein A2U01_0082031, partial [Trifolium medium]|nr:hypothetical protein [Trifolium medium]